MARWGRFEVSPSLLGRKHVRRATLFHALQYQCGVRFAEPETFDAKSPFQVGAPGTRHDSRHL